MEITRLGINKPTHNPDSLSFLFFFLFFGSFIPNFGISLLETLCRDFVERAARQDFIAATDAERRKETHYRDRAAGTKFVPFDLETCGALVDRSDRCLVKCATLASRECAG